ncbi:MAG: AgrD family cyclic lactone autoinducer peptide [Ferruginibacter sp.]
MAKLRSVKKLIEKLLLKIARMGSSTTCT